MAVLLLVLLTALAAAGSVSAVEAQERVSAKDIDLAAGNSYPVGTWSDGVTVWVVDRVDKKLYAYDLDGVEHYRDRDIDLVADNNDPRGIWSDGVTVWVVDRVDKKLYAYDLYSGKRYRDRDIDLRTTNTDALGIWSDGVTVWVVDHVDKKMYAYDLYSGKRYGEGNIDLVAGNDNPMGIWSDGVTVWVVDRVDKKLYAYALQGEERYPDRDIVLVADNNNPAGTWSDGVTVWVVDTDRRLYAYDIAGLDADPRANVSTTTREPVGDIPHCPHHFLDLRYDIGADKKRMERLYGGSIGEGGVVFRVASSSMTPTLHEGDLAIVNASHQYGDIQAGDILMFRDTLAGNSERVIVHRAMLHNGTHWITKGDANELPLRKDAVSPDSYIGTVVGWNKLGSTEPWPLDHYDVIGGEALVESMGLGECRHISHPDGGPYDEMVLLRGLYNYGYKADPNLDGAVHRLILFSALITAAINTQEEPAPPDGTQASDIGLQDAPPAPERVISLLLDNGYPPLGDEDATITLVEFGDYQCHFCNVFFHNTEESVIANYVDTGLVRMVFRDFTIIGPDSITAAHGARCAEEQGLFWEYHDSVYSNWNGENTGWASLDNLRSYAFAAGLNTAVWSACMDAGKYYDLVSASTRDARSLGLGGTPAFFVIAPNGAVLNMQGAQPYEVFERVFDEMLGT